MNITILIIISIAVGILCLFLGILLGCFLGRLGSIYILAFIVRIPIILISSPGKLKDKWKMWGELRDIRKIERLKIQKEVDVLKEKISVLKTETKKIKKQIRHLKWKTGKKDRRP
jgi:hypothetical protein